jgi:hypothetical protein
MPGISERELRAHFGQRRESTPVISHFARYDCPAGRTVQAVCGARVREADVSGDPTCPTCAKWRDEFDTLEIG